MMQKFYASQNQQPPGQFYYFRPVLIRPLCTIEPAYAYHEKDKTWVNVGNYVQQLGYEVVPNVYMNQQQMPQQFFQTAE
jgi:hypothetical protein